MSISPVDLSLYKDESQIEKKGGKRKTGAKKSLPAAKKRKVDTSEGDSMPVAKSKSIARSRVNIFSKVCITCHMGKISTL